MCKLTDFPLPPSLRLLQLEDDDCDATRADVGEGSTCSVCCRRHNFELPAGTVVAGTVVPSSPCSLSSSQGGTESVDAALQRHHGYLKPTHSCSLLTSYFHKLRQTTAEGLQIPLDELRMSLEEDNVQLLTASSSRSLNCINDNKITEDEGSTDFDMSFRDKRWDAPDYSDDERADDVSKCNDGCYTPNRIPAGNSNRVAHPRCHLNEQRDTSKRKMFPPHFPHRQESL